MLNKEELLAHLQEGLKIEETAIPIYSRHITNSLYFSGLPAEKLKALTQILNGLREDSLRHKNIFLSLIKRVQESKQDVY